MIAKVTLSFFCRFGEIKEAAPNRYPKETDNKISRNWQENLQDETQLR